MIAGEAHADSVGRHSKPCCRRELALNLWPFFRIAGVLMVAPVFGARLVPLRVRMALAVAVTFVMSPLIPVTQPFGLTLASGRDRAARSAHRRRDRASCCR